MLRKGLIILLLLVLAEVSLLIYIGRLIGPLSTFLLLIISALFGLWTVKRQGLSILQEIRFDLNNRVMPGAALLDGLCLVFGGFLLAVPGFLTDIAGLLILIPRVRSRAVGWISAWIKDRISRGSLTFFTSYRRKR
ncbi:FxsA family protein [Sporolactobacillus sp. Y61]|uniref:FxsA family protein n=1 Tax=Sporolactobacillus sp. Y61 TaxID=3160863 RepID=A0AAU8IET9_9BACL